MNPAMLDKVWQEVSKEKAIDFLKRSVTPKTSLRELTSILSYEKVTDLREHLADIPISEMISTTQSGGKEKRWRTARDQLNNEVALTLAAIQESPGISRGQLAKKMLAKIGNKNLSHLSYILRRLHSQGKIKKFGDRKTTTYQAK